MKKVLILLCAAAVLCLASCDLIGPYFQIAVEFSPTQYEGVTDNEFTVLFPDATGIADLKLTVPDAEIASHGPTLNATIMSAQVTSNRRFSITGVRIEDVRYLLTPAGGSPIGTSSAILYTHPVLGNISPITPMLGIASESDSAVIVVEEDAPTSFDVGLSSALSMWNHVDADRDNDPFPEDNDEEITVTCSLFFEGYLDNGIEFSGAFPPPLLVSITVRHDVAE